MLNVSNFIAWLYWDPSREIFTVPYIDRPLAWYGIWFVLGFFFGFIIIVPMFKRKLLESKTISWRDIACWATIVKCLKTHRGKVDLLAKQIDPQGQEELDRLKGRQEPSKELKEQILDLLQKSGLTRKELERLFPRGVARVTEHSLMLADRLTWFVVAGTLIGARLGHVFFYGWPYYRENPFQIFKVWEGGLASHGGVIGIIFALCLYRRIIRNRFPELSFMTILDMLAVPAALAACFIRIGNFFNQEILGTETKLPWAVIFGHPMDNGPIAPRHPAQLYEALAYLLTFFLLAYFWKRKREMLQTGMLIGLFFIIVFTSRFLIEFVKVPQSIMFDESFLQTGQYLSLPFIALGIFFYFYGHRWTPQLNRVPAS